MKLGIVGYGVLGKAVYDALKNHHDITIIDPPAGFAYRDTQYNLDCYILCLPTPQSEDGSCDYSLVEFYLEHISNYDYPTEILVKSTVPPIDLCGLEELYDFTYSPEFLRADSAIEDFKQQDFAIFAGHNPEFWFNLLFEAGVEFDRFKFTTIRTAAYIKYAINTFLATKVTFFNELEALFAGDFLELTSGISLDSRIGDSHMQVPGPDGRRGYGGMCFPKDTKAFAKYARDQGKPLELLEKAIELNEKMR